MIDPEEAVAFNSPGVVVTSSSLPFLVQRSEAIMAAVGGAIGPVAVAGTAVALLLVAAGSYWVDRRRVEVALLAARGVGPGHRGQGDAGDGAVAGPGASSAGWPRSGWSGCWGRATCWTPRRPGRPGHAAATTLLAGLALLGLVAAVASRA